VNNDPAQAELAASWIDAASCFMPIKVLLELEWVLLGEYKFPREWMIKTFEGLLPIRHLHKEQEDLVRRALAWERRG